jgi:hypothetical protein
MTSPITKKLFMKAGMRALIVSAPAGYLKLLAPLPEGVTVASTPDGRYPFVQIFAKHLSEIGNIAKQFSKHAAPNAVVWLAYPKQTSGIESDLSRDRIREAMSSKGWNTVSIVALDEVWAALRFRPVNAAK